MQVKLCDLTENAPRDVADGRVLKIVRVNSKNTLNISLELDELIPMTTLLKAGDELASELECADVTLYPKYHISLFDWDYIYDIIELIKRKNVSVNGYFDGAEISGDDNTCEIALKSGGKQILMGLEMDKKIASFVQGFFGKNISVVLSSENELNMEEYVQNLQSEPVESVVISAPPPSSAPSRSQYGSSGKQGGARRSSRPQFLTEPTELMLGFENEHFDSTAKLFFGKGDFSAPMMMSDTFYDQDEVTVWGTVFKTDERVSRDGKTLIFTAYFTDKTSSQVLKIITPEENTDIVKNNISNGKAIIVSGKFEYDSYAKELNLRPNSIAALKTHSRTDNAEQKRVELHMHSNMSDMDAITPVSDLIKQANAWGHPAVAITDHGNVQAYPEAMNTIEKIRKDGGTMKMIYGVEAYFVNDSGSLIAGCNDHFIDDEIIVFDIETTGLS